MEQRSTRSGAEPGVALVTGATGFVGGAVCRALSADGWRVRAATRAPCATPLGAAESVVVGDLTGAPNLDAALGDVDAVVHLAARVHRMREDASDPLAAHRSMNRDATERLAVAAADAGVRRFVFMSSVKALGEGGDRPYRDDDAPAPLDPYGVSKLEGENILFSLHAAGRIEAVALRPPLVYGPGVRANFGAMLRLARSGAPLPFGAIDNARSMIFVDNLADAVRAALRAEDAPGRAVLVSDGEDLSTPEMFRRLARAMGRRARLFPVPASAIRLAARAIGRSALAERVLGSLTIDPSCAERALNWRAPHSVDAGFAATVEAAT